MKTYSILNFLAAVFVGTSCIISGCSKSNNSTSSSSTIASGVNILHKFVGGASDGAGPWGDLLLSGSTLYGMTLAGGGTNAGTCGIIFSINIDGSSFTVLHAFVGGVTNDGCSPNGSLILSGNTLYGTTYEGGSGGTGCAATGSGCGTVFSISTNGTSFTILHSFGDAANDGLIPLGSLVLSNNILYGMTQHGGSSTCTWVAESETSTCGTIFSIGTDGSGYSILHNFEGGTSDGAWPEGSLTVSGSMLYGMTFLGGTYCTTGSSCGTVFSIGTDGSDFSILHNFAGTANADGEGPSGSLTLSGNILYGMTIDGGGYGDGTIFSINKDGSSYLILHNFNALSKNDGSNPTGSLVILSGELYGMTPLGGTNGSGTLFKLTSGGTDFSLLGSFSGQDGDGAEPLGSLIIGSGSGGSTIYGMTELGGNADSTPDDPAGDGIIFSFGI